MTAATEIVPTPRPDSGTAFALIETAQMTITGVGEIRERQPRTPTAHKKERCAMSLPKMVRRRGVVPTADARPALPAPARTGVDR